MTTITFLGTGTSTGIPLIGCKCDTCSSTDKKDKRLRASVLVETNDTTLLIDAGPDLRQQLLLHRITYLDGILVTHEHYDHIGGLDDVRPLGNMNVYAEEGVLHSIRRNMPYCFAENRYPGVPMLHLHTINTEPFSIYTTRIQPLRLMHARLPILGFRIGDFAYLTDVKTIPKETFTLLRNLKVLVLNALRHEPHIAHLNLDDAIEMAQRIGARKTFFTHFSHDIGKHEIVSLNLPENIELAFDGLQIKV
ncbi:MAG: MBL fold metallo-hydrolase [Paludibacter sp.]|jgi:phosphoribosyl 1,2-cyclic phosphate phosphodiesterase|nr:MBL fold metallo-hydrolase [Paludibacter sp.]